MAWTLTIAFLFALSSIGAWGYASRLREQLALLKAQYDTLAQNHADLIAAIRAKAQPVVPQVISHGTRPRRARTFQEFRDAAELGTLPHGMTVKEKDPNV